mmetsp:Transcript_25731/g.56719  ORF Transcript_25731/g.56719 Transcript_25731/m.56719 type:complete len:250 (+) Transcript_25731:884-1633(+)
MHRHFSQQFAPQNSSLVIEQVHEQLASGVHTDAEPVCSSRHLDEHRLLLHSLRQNPGALGLGLLDQGGRPGCQLVDTGGGRCVLGRSSYLRLVLHVPHQQHRPGVVPGGISRPLDAPLDDRRGLAQRGDLLHPQLRPGVPGRGLRLALVGQLHEVPLIVHQAGLEGGDLLGGLGYVLSEGPHALLGVLEGGLQGGQGALRGLGPLGVLRPSLHLGLLMGLQGLGVVVPQLGQNTNDPLGPPGGPRGLLH